MLSVPRETSAIIDYTLLELQLTITLSTFATDADITLLKIIAQALEQDFNNRIFLTIQGKQLHCYAANYADVEQLISWCGQQGIKPRSLLSSKSSLFMHPHQISQHIEDEEKEEEEAFVDGEPKNPKEHYKKEKEKLNTTQFTYSVNSAKKKENLAPCSALTISLDSPITQQLPQPLRHLRHMLQQQMQYHNQHNKLGYIPMQGTKLYEREQSFYLLDKIQEHFIGNAQEDVLLLIGDSGAGKSTFTHALVTQCWKNYQVGQSLALWIPLAYIHCPETELLEEYFDNLLHCPKVLTYLKDEKIPLLLILDGYEEAYPDIETAKNLGQSNGFNALQSLYPGHVQLLFTCRMTALKGQPEDYLDRFCLSEKKPPLIYEIQPFDNKQIEAMTRAYTCMHRTQWDADTYRKEMHELPDLLQLITKPYLLYMALKTLPAIVAKYKQHRSNSDQQIWQWRQLTRYDLYQTFMQDWFHRQATKLQGKHRDIIPKLIENYGYQQLKDFENETKALCYIFSDFTQRLAQAMYNHGQAIVTWNPGKETLYEGHNGENKDVVLYRQNPPSSSNAILSQTQLLQRLHITSTSSGNLLPRAQRKKLRKKLKPSALSELDNQDTDTIWLAPFFDDQKNPYLPYLRAACPLMPLGSNRWGWIHNSLLEFYAAKHLFNGALVKSWIMSRCNLNSYNLQNTPDVLQFLVDKAKRDVVFKHTLFEVIEESKVNPNAWKAAANAITILNYAKVSFSGRDFRRIRIGGEEVLSFEAKQRMRLDIILVASLQEFQADHARWRPRIVPNTSYLIYVIANQQWYLHCEGPQGTLLTSILDNSIDGAKRLRVALENLDPTHITQAQRLELKQRLMDITIPLRHGWGADLSSAILSQCDFSDSDLRYTILSQAQLADTQWDRACLDGVDFGEKATLKATGFAYHASSNHMITYKNKHLWLYAMPEQIHLRTWRVNIKIQQVAFTSQGKSLAIIGGKELILWDLKQKVCLKKFRSKYTLTTLDASPINDNLLIAEQINKQHFVLRLWDVTNANVVEVFKADKDINKVAWSPKGTYVAVLSEGTLHVGNVNDKNDWFVLPSTYSIDAIAWSPDSTQLASGSSDKTVRLWNIKSKRCIKELIGHTRPIHALAWSPNSLYLAGGDGFAKFVSRNLGDIRIWYAETGVCQQILQSYTQKKVTSLAWTSDNKHLISSSHDDSIRIWLINPASSPIIDIDHINHIGYVKSVTWSPDNKFIASGGEDKTIRIWRVDNGRCIKVLKGHKKSINTVAWAPTNCDWLASGGKGKLSTWIPKEFTNLPEESEDNSTKQNSGLIKIWQVKNGNCIRTMKGETYGILSVAWASNSQLLASCGISHPVGTQSIRIWKVETGQCLYKLFGHTEKINSIAWSPKSELLASASDDSTVRLWKVREERLLWQTPLEFMEFITSPRVTSISWSPDGKRVVIAHEGLFSRSQQKLRILELETGRCLKMLKGHKTHTYSVAWNPNDARWLASSGGKEDVFDFDFSRIVGTVHLWRAQDSLCIRTMCGSTALVNQVVWSPNGRYLLSGSNDGALGLWELKINDNQANLHLIWKSASNEGLVTHSLSISQATGLNLNNYRLLQQRSGKMPIQGNLSQTRKSEHVLSARNAQVYIPEGQLVPEFLPLQAEKADYTITPDKWLLAMVRKKCVMLTENDAKARIPSSTTASQASHHAIGPLGGHVWFIIQGLGEDHYTVIKEIHFFLDESEPMYLHKTLGKGLIQIRDCSPYDLQGKAKLLEGRFCMLRKEQIEQLLEAVEAQEKNPPNYSLRGRRLGLFGQEAYSCLTWCLEQVKAVVDKKTYHRYFAPKEGEGHWLEFFCAIPTHYIPLSPEETQTVNSKSSCMTM